MGYTIKHKRCEKCQKFYAPIREDQRFCCTECHNAFRYIPLKKYRTKTCLNCGIKFRTNIKTQKFHTDKCREEYHKLEKKYYVRKCGFCGKKLTTTDSRTRYHKECKYPAKLQREHDRYMRRKHGTDSA